MAGRIYTKAEEPLIGGPGTWLPRPMESFLGWSLAIGCLSVSGYHYLIATFVSPTLFRIRILLCKATLVVEEKNGFEELPCWLPLTTSSRDELACGTPQMRFLQLVSLLRRLTKHGPTWSDEALIKMIRSSDVVRRLVSLAMRPVQLSSTKEAEQELPAHTLLGQQLVRVWPALLALPPHPTKSMFDFDISLIVPVYREEGALVKAKLLRACQSCCVPLRVEVVVVDAGSCTELELVDVMRDAWGDLRVVSFTSGGGRGPCLNFGARQARGRIYTFCHSDTTLPDGWDVTIIQGLDDSSVSRPNCCAFAFGIDTTTVGLNGGHLPPGIRAVQTTANLRTHMYSLPYGDQVLSVPAVVFDYLGGYPDQCLMEDYELVSLLRQRAALLSRFGLVENEHLAILKGPPALCSPRRWQKFGVLYVTFMNSKFVNLYSGGLSPDDMFRLYYGRPAPARECEVAPWENEISKLPY